MGSEGQSLQVKYAPNSRCFGCGPANNLGLRIESRMEGDLVVADWKPSPHHLAFTGYVNGGIIGTLLDCHSNWAATVHLMKKKGLSTPPGTVTANYCVTHHRPTPIDSTLHATSRIVDSGDDRATVETTLEADGRLRATFKGTFVAVKENHPAYERWR